MAPIQATKIGTFRVFQKLNGTWTVRDYDPFNNYGVKSEPFWDKGMAEDYAQRCHDFKQGRRSII